MTYINQSSQQNESGSFSRRGFIKNSLWFIPALSVFPDIVPLFGKSAAIGDQTVEHKKMIFETFLKVVIPGAYGYCEFLAKAFADEFYGFSKYINYLIKDLDKSSFIGFNKSFLQLSDKDKKQIVHEGTQKGLLKKQVYNGAIYLLQLIVFAGLCEEDQSCKIIDYPGRSRGQFETYPDFQLIGVKSITSNGNPL